MLTLKRMFLGLNGIAIYGKKLDISIRPKFDTKTGQPICTEWYLSGATFDKTSKLIKDVFGDAYDDICMKDFVAGILVDDDHNNVGVKFFDASGKYPRFIVDRTPTNGVFLRKRGGGTSTSSSAAVTKSAFSRLLTILQAYYPNKYS